MSRTNAFELTELTGSVISSIQVERNSFDEITYAEIRLEDGRIISIGSPSPGETVCIDVLLKSLFS